MSENFTYKNPGEMDPLEQAYLAGLMCHWLKQAIEAGERVIPQDKAVLLDRIQHHRAILAFSPMGSPVGCIFLHPLGQSEDGVENDEPGSLYVIPKFRGHRIGVNLVNHLASEFPHVRMYATIKDDHAQIRDRSLKSFDDPQNGFSEISFRTVNPQALIGLCLTAPCFLANQNGHLSCVNEALEHPYGHCHVTVRQPTK